MAKKERTDRQAVIDSIRNKQKGTEKRRGFAIVGVCVTIALLIVGAAAYQPIKNWYDLRGVSSMALDEIGAKADACSEITTKKANGSQDHVPAGTPIAYEDSPPAFGQHYDVPAQMERKLYTSDRPDLGTLVHNLEHGYTVLWYDKTVADSDAMMDDLRGIADKLKGTENLRDKFIAAPWTSEDGEPFPGGQHVALTHWSIGGAGETLSEEGQEGIFQYCSAPSGAALEDFMEKYPYLDSPEPGAA